jgi:hypothetical protein
MGIFKGVLGAIQSLARYPEHYDDCLGQVRSSISGGTLWAIEPITGTIFNIGALRDNSNDFFQLTIQMPHKRKQGSIAADLHAHLVLQTNYTAGQTIVWTGKYVWINPDTTIPPDASWNPLTIAPWTWDTNKTAPYYDIKDFTVNIPAPVGENYGSMVLAYFIRGDGTYSGNVGILDSDMHSLMDRFGSKFRFWD